jgi:DNA-binding transcriptional MerR regulator
MNILHRSKKQSVACALRNSIPWNRLRGFKKIAKNCLTLPLRQARGCHQEVAVTPESQELFQARAFARLAGVTVRALHHYDKLGLLKPKQRSRSGYRLYSQRDFGRLEQIVVLKFLGMSLKQIRGLLEADAKLAQALERQQVVLAEKRRHLDRAVAAIKNAQQCFDARREPDWNLLKYVVQEIEMQNSVDWSKKYYSPEAQEKVEARKALWSPELQERVSREWSALFADVEAALGENPGGPKAQELAARWEKLVGEFTGGDRQIQQGLNAMYADQANWPAATKSAYTIKPQIMDFITKAMRAAK